MKKLIELSSNDAMSFLLEGSSYFNNDLPSYLRFDPIIRDVKEILGNNSYKLFQSDDPAGYSEVNYSFLTNKDGRLAWRPLEVIHPVIYVSLVNLICEQDNWKSIQERFSKYSGGVVECCSEPVVSIDEQTDTAKQIRKWWQEVEQKSLVYSLEFSRVLHTDVSDCYGSLYTHSIPWALYGIKESKHNRKDKNLGNGIDAHIRAGRYGQTNGISQGSVLMNLIAEIVLGYIDMEINSEIDDTNECRIIRYRDDYRVFTNNEEKAEKILKIISEKLLIVGMKLSVSKTQLCRNVVEGVIKPDKLAGIDLQELGEANAKTIQKQLLRLHSFGQRFPNSGALRRLVGEFHSEIIKQRDMPDDLEVQVAIATDIGLVSPSAFPAIAGILSHLISLAGKNEKRRLWEKVRNKMMHVPYNGYLEIWLQRVIQPKAVDIQFASKESICKIVNKEKQELWNSKWIGNQDLLNEIDTSKILVGSVEDKNEVITPEEIDIFTRNAWLY